MRINSTGIDIKNNIICDSKFASVFYFSNLLLYVLDEGEGVII